MTELRYAARVFVLLGSPDSVAVLHMGGAYADKPASAARFVGAMGPEARVLLYLVLKNDTRASGPRQRSCGPHVLWASRRSRTPSTTLSTLSA